MRWYFNNAELVMELPLKAQDNDSECYSILEIYHDKSSGHVFARFTHSDSTYCYLFGFYRDNCKAISCLECPNTKYFLKKDGLPIRCLSIELPLSNPICL